MRNFAPGRWVFMFSCVVSHDVMLAVNPERLSTQLQDAMIFPGNMSLIQGGTNPTVTIMEIRQILGENRWEVDTIVCVETTMQVSDFDLAKMFVGAWNETVRGYRMVGTIVGTNDSTINTDRAAQLMIDCSRWQTGVASQEDNASILPSITNFFTAAFREDNFYQVCFQAAPYTGGANNSPVVPDRVNSLFTSNIQASNNPNLVGQNVTATPGLADIQNATQMLGLSESDWKFIGYLGLGMVGAFLLLKIIREIKNV